MAYADVINAQQPFFYNNGSSNFDSLPGGAAGKIDTGFNVSPYVNNQYGTVYGPTNVSTFSLSFYVKVGGVTGNQQYTLARFLQNGTQKFRFAAQGKSGNFDYVIYDYSNNPNVVVLNADPTKWYHIAIRRTTSPTTSYEVFVDGVKIGSTFPIGSWTATTWQVQMGMYGTGYDFNKSFDEIAAFTALLTDQQIADQYAAGNAPTTVSTTQTATPAVISLSGNNVDFAAFNGDPTKKTGYSDLVNKYSRDQYGLNGASLDFDGTSLTPVEDGYSAYATWSLVNSGAITPAQAGRFSGGYRMANGGAFYFKNTSTTKVTPELISFWFKANPTNAYRALFKTRYGTDTGAAGSTNISTFVGVNSAGMLTNDYAGAVTNFMVADGNWHFFAFDGSKVYIDNVDTGITRVGGGGNLQQFYVVGNPSGANVTFIDEVAVNWTQGSQPPIGSPYSSTVMRNGLYSFVEARVNGVVSTMSLYGTTANGVSNKTAIVQTALPATLGLNGTYNNKARVDRKVAGAVGNATLSAVAATVKAARIFAQKLPAATMNLSAIAGNAFSPNKVIKLPPFELFMQGTSNSRAYSPQGTIVKLPTATVSLSAVPASVTLRTHRTIKQDQSASMMLRGGSARIKVGDRYVEGLNDNNRWYKAIREIYPAKIPGPYWDDPQGNLGVTSWFNFEGAVPPYEKNEAAGPNLGSGPGVTTGEVKANPLYEMGIDAGRTRSGIKFTNGGFFQTKRRYPYTIWGATQGLSGGLQTHYTAEFAFKADAPGPIFDGVRVNAAGRLEVISTDVDNSSEAYWYELRTEYANLLDGNWHHMILISPRDDYFVSPGANKERRYVLVDGKVVSAVHAPYYVPNAWGYDSFTNTANPSISFDDIIISMFRILSLNEAQRLYYEYSEAVITKVLGFKMTLDATKNHRPKGNVKRMLVFYGSPKERRNASFENDQVAVHVNSYSGFKLNEQPDKTTGRKYPGAATTFRWDEYLCFPVSYTGGNASAEGILDRNRATYVDDTTGYTRLLDLENDFAVDPKDFDAVTFIRWPQMSDKFVTLPSVGGPRFDDQSNSNVYKYATTPGVEANDIIAARQNTINKFAKQVISLAHNGVGIIVQDGETAVGLGLTKSFEDLDQFSEGSEENGVLNQGTRATETKYGRGLAVGTFGSPGYADTGHNLWKRRITAVLPGYSDIPSHYMVDRLEWTDSNPFAKHARQMRYKYTGFQSLSIGDEIASDTVTTHGDIARRYYEGYFAANQRDLAPGAVIIAKAQAEISLKNGSYITNPYKDYVVSFALPEGTNFGGKAITGRIFVEMNEGYTYNTRMIANDKKFDDGRPVQRDTSQWDYDSTRENQIVAYYALERFRQDLYIGSENNPYIVFGDGVPVIWYNRVSFISRGGRWVGQITPEAPGNATVKAPAANMLLGAVPAKQAAQLNTKVRSDVGRMRLEMKFVKNINNPDARITAFPPVLSLRAVDPETRVKLPVATMVITGGNGLAITDRTPDFTVFYEVFAPTLYLEEL